MTNLGTEVRKEPGQRMGAGRAIGKECRRWVVNNIYSPNVIVKGFWNYLSQIIGGGLR